MAKTRSRRTRKKSLDDYIEGAGKCTSNVSRVWQEQEKGNERVVASMSNGSVVEVRSVGHMATLMHKKSFRSFCTVASK